MLRGRGQGHRQRALDEFGLGGELGEERGKLVAGAHDDVVGGERAHRGLDPSVGDPAHPDPGAQVDRRGGAQ
ncbi:hypothetical protein IOD13_12175 [Brevibacterium casei]|nr:hypothetical protein [Brevibacterium casei]